MLRAPCYTRCRLQAPEVRPRPGKASQHCLLSGPEAQPADSANLRYCSRHWRLKQGEKISSTPLCLAADPSLRARALADPSEGRPAEKRRRGRGAVPRAAVPTGCSTGGGHWRSACGSVLVPAHPRRGSAHGKAPRLARPGRTMHPPPRGSPELTGRPRSPLSTPRQPRG